MELRAGDLFISSGHTGLVAFNGGATVAAQGAYFSFTPDYDAALRAGHTSFAVTAYLHDGSTTVAEVTSEPFAMTAQHAESLHKARFVQTQRHVRMEIPVFHPACGQFDVDWGDGSPHDRIVIAREQREQCSLTSDVTTFEHEYAAAGTYQIKVVSTELGNLFGELDEEVGYQLYMVDVP
jgi:hypothetical protein